MYSIYFIRFVRDLNEKDRLELEEKAQQIRETALVQDLGIKRLE